MKDSKRKSLLKAISWRCIGTIDTIVLAYIFTGRADISFGIGGFEFINKTILYYLHERAWLKF